MKDFAKSIRTNNSKVGNANQVYTDSDITIYDDGTVKIDYFKGYTQKIGDVPSIVRDEISALKTQIAELERVEKKAKEYKGKVGNSKVGNYIMNVTDQANEYSKGFSEALKKGDKSEAEKVSGYAKILKRQIKEEREEIQKRLKDLDNAERIMGSVGNKKVGNSATYDRLENAISVIYTYYHMANRQLESGSFSATNCINALSHIKQACDEAIKLAQQYDREINK